MKKLIKPSCYQASAHIRSCKTRLDNKGSRIMAFFSVRTSLGLESALDEELASFNIKRRRLQKAGVAVECNWYDVYRLHFLSRLATRILKPAIEFPAYHWDDLYNQIKKKHDFTKYFECHHTFRVRASVKDSRLHDQRMVALKTKDAIVDQFREKYGQRPNVERLDADVSIFINVQKNHVRVAIDLTGSPLSQRGYRKVTVEAPLAEHLASGVLNLSGWSPDQPLIDLMCGSGTIPIEAANLRCPLTPRAEYPFMKFANFDRQIWQNALESKPSSSTSDQLIMGADADRKAIEAARKNHQFAKTAKTIEWRHCPFEKLEPPAPSGVIVSNLPYGQRLKDPDSLIETYISLGKILKQRWSGWDAWFLSGNAELTQHLGLKAQRKIPLQNSSIECRLLHYPIQT